MSRPERTRRLRVSAVAEPFEPRQLMHSGPLLLKEAAVALSGTADLGPWGRLKLVDRLEKQGDHQFDAMDERLTIKLDHWELKHPTLAREWGLTKPTPLGSGNASISTTQIALSTPPRFNLARAGQWLGRVA